MSREVEGVQSKRNILVNHLPPLPQVRNVLGWLSVSFYFTFARENKRNFSHLRQAKDEECISGKEGRVDVLAHRHLKSIKREIQIQCNKLKKIEIKL